MRKLVLVLAAAAVVGTSGVAVAATASGAMELCYDTKTGIVRVDVEGTGCRVKEAALALPGAAFSTRQVAAQASVTGIEMVEATAMCAAGEVVLGGGFDKDSIAVDVQIMASGPVIDGDLQGWHAVMVNDLEGYTQTVYVTAICAPGIAR